MSKVIDASQQFTDKMIDECIKLGWMEELPNGKLRLTPEGIRHIEGKLSQSKGEKP